jgi:hypothetical protein
MKILKYFRDRQEKDAFFLLKAFCGPQIPFYLLKGEGNYPEVDLNSKMEEYRKNKSSFNKLIRMFPKYIYFVTSEDIKSVQEIPAKVAFNFSEVRMHCINHLKYGKINYLDSKSSGTSISDYFGMT